MYIGKKVRIKLPASVDKQRVPADISVIISIDDRGILILSVPYAKLATKVSVVSAMTKNSDSNIVKTVIFNIPPPFILNIVF